MMRRRLKVKFVDFWVDMNRLEDNYFVDLLSNEFEVELSETPDVLFYSCFGKEYLKYPCTRIFFTPENWRPNFTECNYAISFDYLQTPRNLRLPLWYLYYISYQQKGLVKQQTPAILFEDWVRRPNFCCIIVSNPNARERINFYHALSEFKRVDSAGRWNNNIGQELPAGTESKFEFISSYRFVISFENSSHPGYTTEKVLEPLLAGCIPVYWGDPLVGQDFNSSRFINIEPSGDFHAAVSRILTIENDPEQARPFFEGGIFNPEPGLPPCFDSERNAEVVCQWIREAETKQFRGPGAGLNGKLKVIFNTTRAKFNAMKLAFRS